MNSCDVINGNITLQAQTLQACFSLALVYLKLCAKVL